MKRFRSRDGKSHRRVSPKKDLFDALGDTIRLPIAIVSGTFTGKLLSKLLGFEGIDEILIVIVTASLFTIFEVVCFRRWARHLDPFALLLGIMIATTSISGSVGYFYVSFKEAVLQSDDYQQQKAIYDNWIAKTDKSEYPDTYAWNLVQAQKAKAKLDEIRHSGAGVGNAYYEIFAKLFNCSMETAALYATLFIALIIELILIYSAVKTDDDYTIAQGNVYPGDQVNATGTPVHQDHTNGHPVQNIAMGFQPPRNEAPTLPEKEIIYIEKPTIEHIHTTDRLSIDELNRRRKRKMLERLNQVRKVLRQYPNLSQENQAKTARMPLSTFRRYIKKYKLA